MQNEMINSLLEKHFRTIQSVILSRQDPITGLLPASTAITAHGDYTDAWVRDNVYSILSVWGLALSYHNHTPHHHRTHILSQSVVKLMRGLLSAMMRQADHLEAFKKTQDPLHALHAKYGTHTGLAVVGDGEWGHLQLDATSLFLLMSAQMIASGLTLIYTLDEVDFVQNLVHYISRAYCTPDYGIWERGNKINHGTAEINCSSVGMAKAALEALDGFNLFGNIEDQAGVIHVAANDIARSRFTLSSLLPRESNSKETDGALLSIIGYPAYAIEDEKLVIKTRKKIIKKLSGRYGCKRFLLDGHQSSIEDNSRLHYEPSELREFENIESQWPLFYTYFLLDAHIRGDNEAVLEYKNLLEPLFIEQDGVKLLPELYYVPKESIAEEKANPNSQQRLPNENIPLVWAQSLYLLSEMIDDKILHVSDIDPLKRHKRIGMECHVKPLIAVLAENQSVKEQLSELGFFSQSLKEIQPLCLMQASELSQMYTMLGKNEKLGLSGRSFSVARTITTSRLYKYQDQNILFLPYYFNPQGFYLSYDNKLLCEHFRSSIKFLIKHWDKSEQPLMPFLVREDMLKENQKDVITELLEELKEGYCDTNSIITGAVDDLLALTNVEQIDYIDHFEFKELQIHKQGEGVCQGAYEITPPFTAQQIQALELEDELSLVVQLLNINNRQQKTQILKLLFTRNGEEHIISVEDQSYTLKEIAENLYEAAALCHDWSVIRQLADLLGIYDERIEDALLDLVIHQKRLAVGRAYSEKATFHKPHDSHFIIKTIDEFCGNNSAERVLTQEIILHLGHLIRIDTHLFDNMLTVRTWYFVQLLVGQIARDYQLSLADAYELLIGLAPHALYNRLRSILNSFSLEVKQLIDQENLNVSGATNLQTQQENLIEVEDIGCDNWAQWREKMGMISHLSSRFYKNTWHLLQQCSGVVIGDKYNLQSRIGSESTLESTAGEYSFAIQVDSLLQNIYASDYRQLNIEAIETLSRVTAQNPDLHVNNDLVLDVLIGYAVRLAWQKNHEVQNYDEARGSAWESFYRLSPKETDQAFVEAFLYLLHVEAINNEETA